jgi:hypothetical protein
MNSDSPQAQEAYAEQQWASNPAVEQYLNQNYPDLAWAMNIPDLKTVLISAAVNGWDQGKINAALFATPWWQQNGALAASFIEQQQTDPAQAAQTIAGNKAQLLSYAQSMGVQLTDSQLTNLATSASMFQWNQEQMTQALRAKYQAPGPGGATLGDAATMQQNIKTVAGNYLVNADANMINWWTTAGIKGGQTPDQVTAELSNYLGQQAAQRFPWMKDAISKGMTPKDYLSPYTTQAANTLSISPDQINWTDPKWQAALLGSPDAAGNTNPVNVDQFNKNLMKNPVFGFSKTQNAINQAYSVAKTLETTFGAIK